MRVVLLLGLAWLGAAAESFYDVLGLEKDAENRAIRRAYKKLAMHFHPDKNKEEGAHDRFVRINRAYEVLKDEDLRKKYDAFGEEGLKDNFQPNPGPSWQFFQTFGIYDEDHEIATLTRADFASSVLDSGAAWFVNFYSTHCGHCHQLAPSWRRVGLELAGVIRIGAVNCAEDPMLCQEQGVQGYPALLLYPERVLYPGARETSALVEWALSRLAPAPRSLGPRDVAGLMGPWLLHLPTDANHKPLSDLTLKKLSVMLAGLVGVGGVDCAAEEELCDALRPDDTDGAAFFFPDGKRSAADAVPLAMSDAQELGNAVLSLLPDLLTMSREEFEEREESQPLLVHFVSNSGDADVTFRKLTSLLPDLLIRRINCSTSSELCAQLFITKTPTFAVFKTTGGYEIHHGSMGLDEVVGFAKESSKAPVRVVTGPEDFRHRARLDDRLLRAGATLTMMGVAITGLIQWCPPCMRLLPELRKASVSAGGRVGFATVDCTLHAGVCAEAQVQSYPTSVLFNASAAPNPFVGLHGAAEILEFIQDVENPPVEVLSPETFASRVLGRADGTTWLVDFFAPWCGPCQQLAPEWRRLAKLLGGPEVMVGSVDCSVHQSFCMEEKIQGYPSIRLYHLDKKQPVQHYQNQFRDAGNMRLWASAFLPSLVETVTLERFQEIVSSSEVWLLDFYAPWCGPCQIFAPEFESVARAVEPLGVRLGKVDCDAHRSACTMAGINAYPSVRFYPGSPSAFEAQSEAGALHIGSQVAQQIVDIVRQQMASRKPSPKPKIEL